MTPPPPSPLVFGPLTDLELTCTRQTGEVTVRAWAMFAGEKED
jgi:hypothetical protein